MGVPEIAIKFKELIHKPFSEVSTGKVLLILKDSKIAGKKRYYAYEEVTEDYQEANKNYIRDVFKGNIQDVRVNNELIEQAYQPDEVIVYSITGDDNIDKALVELEETVFDYVVMPDAEVADNTKLINFVKMMKENNLETFAVLSTAKKSDSEDIIEFAIDNFTYGEVQYTSANLLPRIAGILAGTPLEQSVTYATIGEIGNIPTKTKTEINALVNAGKVTLLKKGGKVRIASGVTSLTTTGADTGKGSSFKKIKPVRTYKYINNVICDMLTNYYIGKVQNSYTNKIALIVEIKNYLKDLAKRQLIHDNYDVDIDIEAQKKYLKQNGVDPKNMSNDDIRQADTGNKVMLAIKLRAIDAMEDFNINIEV